MLRLASALEAAGWSVWVDRDDVPPASEWREELAGGIRAAHTFVFVLSPNSLASDFCRWELGEAVRLGKRLIPIVIRDVDAAPEELASRQYVFIRPEDDFGQSLTTLTTALATDLDWVREHRHWLLEALRWEAHDRDRSLLVRGRDLARAEEWFGRQAAHVEPRPTELQAAFLLASRASETRRTRIVAGAVSVALAVTIVLGVVALFQRNEARDQAATARSRELAIAADSQLAVDPQRALLLAIEAVTTKATGEADNALRRATYAHRLEAEVPVRAKRVGALVNSVAFSPDGKTIAAALKDGTISVATPVRRASRLTVLPRPRPRAGDVCSIAADEQLQVAFSGDGRRIAAVNAVGWISVWRWPRPRAPRTSAFCLGRETSPRPTDLTRLLSGGGVVAPAALAFATPTVVEVVEGDGDVVRWRWASDGRPALRRLGRPPVVAAALSDDGRVIAVARDATVEVVRRDGATLRSLPLADVYAVAVNADGTTVAAVTGRSVVVWRPGEAGGPLTLRAPSTVRSVAVDGRGDVVAAGDNAHAIRVWDLSSDREPIVLTGSRGAVTAVRFSSDGKRIVSGSDDGVLRVWAWDASRPPSSPAFRERDARLQLTSDGRLLAVDAEDAKRGWILAGGQARPVDGLPSATDVSVSREGRRAAAPVAPVTSGEMLLWDVSRGAEPQTITLPRAVNGVALSPDGRWLAVAQGRVFRVMPWLQVDGRVLASSDSLQYTTPTFSHDGRRLAVAGYTARSSTVLVWDVAAGVDAARAPSWRFSALGGANDIGFSHDGEKLAVAGSDGAVRVWDLAREPSAIVLRGHEGPVNGVAFSPNGSELVSGGSEGTVRVWELATGRAVTFPGPGDHLVEVAFPRGGSEIIATSTRGTRVWSCRFCGPTSEVLARARRLTTRELTAAERALFLHER